MTKEDKIIRSIMALGSISGELLEAYFNKNGDVFGYEDQTISTETIKVWTDVLNDFPGYKKMFLSLPNDLPFMTKLWIVNDLVGHESITVKMFEEPDEGYEYSGILHTDIAGDYMREFRFSDKFPPAMMNQNPDIWDKVLPLYPDIKERFESLSEGIPFIIRLRASILWAENANKKKAEA